MCARHGMNERGWFPSGRRACGVEGKQRVQRLISIVFLVGFKFHLVAIRVLTVKAIPECKGKRAELGIVCQAFIKLFADMLNLANHGIWKIARGFHGKTPVSVGNFSD